MENKNAMRYERKFFVEDFDYAEMEMLIKLHPACFSEIYHPRFINNIYFDSPSFSNYFDNVEGNKNRIKFRIRWYGEQFGLIKNPVLEIKIKKALLGTKKYFPLPDFNFEKPNNPIEIKNIIEKADLPLDIRFQILAQNPVLLNRYQRKYFISADKIFRMTLDNNLYVATMDHANFRNHKTDEKSLILELKYDENQDFLAKEIGQHFPFRMTKSSKYAQGIEYFYGI